MPDFRLEDIEDYYTLYVMIIGISEDVFWQSDISFILSIGMNINAYEGWLNSVREG